MSGQPFFGGGGPHLPPRSAFPPPLLVSLLSPGCPRSPSLPMVDCPLRPRPLTAIWRRSSPPWSRSRVSVPLTSQALRITSTHQPTWSSDRLLASRPTL